MTLFREDAPGHPNAPARRHPRHLLVGWALLAVGVVVIGVLAVLRAPYAIEGPGPVWNTIGTTDEQGADSSGGASDAKPLISISGAKTYRTSGSLDMLTVSVRGTPDNLPSWAEVISAWFTKSDSVIPIQELYPENATSQQIDQENEAEMTSSQQDAVAAALTHLHMSYTSTVEVAMVAANSPASGKLEKGDTIVSVDGTVISDYDQLHAAIAKSKGAAPLRIVVDRAGTEHTYSLTAVKSSASGWIIGIGISSDYEFPLDVSYGLSSVGGPSAGMMFSLGIIDKLTPGALTGGEDVAGTGTITADGTVGAIGGIVQKMYAAKAAGATDFLAPKSNCADVAGHVPSGLHVYSVATLDQSVTAVNGIADGHTSALPTCGS